MDNNDIQELIDLAEEAIAYTPPYFRVKWDMENRLETLKGSWTEHASKKTLQPPRRQRPRRPRRRRLHRKLHRKRTSIGMAHQTLLRRLGISFDSTRAR